jgi:hypothetical protein
MDWHNNHGGWECDWPLTVVIIGSKDSDGPSCAYLVEREMCPEFYAEEIKEKKDE